MSAIQRHLCTELVLDHPWIPFTELVKVSEATADWTRASASLVETHIELVLKRSSRSATASPHPDGMPIEVLVSPPYGLCILVQQSQSSSPVSKIVPSGEQLIDWSERKLEGSHQLPSSSSALKSSRAAGLDILDIFLVLVLTEDILV